MPFVPAELARLWIFLLEGTLIVFNDFTPLNMLFSNDSIECSTAQLVAKGYSQRHGVISKTFGPIAKLKYCLSPFKILLQFCFWPIYQHDIKNFFLHNTLVRKIHGSTIWLCFFSSQDFVCLLQKFVVKQSLLDLEICH